MVPSSWIHTTFEKHIDCLTGYAFKSSNYSDSSSDIKLLRGDNIEPGSLRWRDAKYWSINQLDGLERYQLNKGDFVVALDRTWISSGLKVAEVRSEDLPCLLVQRVIRVRAKKTLEQGLLRQYFSGHKFEQYVKSVQTATAVPHISPNDIKEFPLLLPPLAEQHKIAQILSTWDQAISATEKLIESSQKQKKALMQQLLTGKKRLLDENGVKFSNEWATKNLESLVYRPLCYGVLKPGEDVLDGHPLIRIQDIDDRGFIDIRKVIRITDELHYEFRRTILNTNDLIISIVGTLGKVFVIPKELNGANITRAFAVIGADCKLIDTRFIYQYLNSSMIQEWLLNTATGNAQKVLNIAALKELQIPLPIIEEQRRIAEVLFVADQEIETIQKKLDCLKQEKKALMQQLLTGKKRVKVAA